MFFLQFTLTRHTLIQVRRMADEGRLPVSLNYINGAYTEHTLR